MPYTTAGTPSTAAPVLAYRHVQYAASTLWFIVHSLGFRPSGVLITDFDGNQVEGVVTHLDAATTTITFAVPLRGIADLS